ncbi:MAG: response regulator [Candidatus Omnitrophota bacterium]
MEGKKVRLLIVDDEPEVGNLLKHYLSAREYEVTVTFSGEGALKILEKQPMDLILLDILMHGMSGEKVAKIVKEKYPDIKIVVVTAFPHLAEKIAREVELAGCFIKPEGIEDIYQKLQKISL